MRYIIFFLAWLLILSSGYVYVARRVIKGANLYGRPRRQIWYAAVALFLLPQIPFFMLVARIEALWLDVWFWAGFSFLGFLSLLIVSFILRDVALLMNGWIRRLQPRSSANEVFDVGRRRFLLHSTNLGLMAASGLLTGYGIYEARTKTTFEDVPIRLPRLPKEFDGFRIVQFTDLHVGPTIKLPFVERVTREVMDLKPDLIVFTGDLVDGSVPWLRDDVAPLAELTAVHGKFFITGNHEYYSGANSWIEHADKIGFTVLMNEHRVIEKEKAGFILAGITDYTAGDFIPEHKSSPSKAIAGAPKGLVSILLAHQPRSLFEAEKAGFDVQLSGHTHGGQFFPWNYLATLNQPYIKGLHRHGNMHVYVSRGTGYWGPPLRLGVPPEITVITLRSSATG